MKISYNWLKQYVSTDLDPAGVAAILTGCGLEVESMEPWSSVEGGLEGVVIGEVLTCEKHPDSDHLTLTTVNIGRGDPLPVVCGAPNVAAGQKVAVATVGTTLHFKGKELVIKKSKIRGQVSEGMICAEDELGLGDSHEGIMVLDPGAVPGTPAKEYFRIVTDMIFEVGLTPNRPDAASHIGAARDLAAAMRCEAGRTGGSLPEGLRMPDVTAFRAGPDGRKIGVIIEDPQACPRYSGLTMTHVRVAESPEWLKNRLNSIGLRPINNIVDLTNFILHETGQPLHAFDADRIEGETVIIKKAKEGEKFVTLDELERTLTGNDLMICNTREPMCIAGVFGGIRSGVTFETKNIFLESACFNPTSIRRTARHHNLQTDASFRFERGADIGITVFALMRAALMIGEIAGGEISSDIVDVYPGKADARVVAFTFKNFDRLAGQKIDRDLVRGILQDLGIGIRRENESGFELEIPSYKVDVTREADVIEEILRIYGFNNIDYSEEIRSSLSYVKKPDPEKVRNNVSEWLSANGFCEMYNNSLTRTSYYEGNASYGMDTVVPVCNPLSRDLGVMRRTLLYGGLESIAYNQNRRIQDIRFYEFGRTYRKDHSGRPVKDPLEKYQEEKHLALFMTGRAAPESWNSPVRSVSFFDLKGTVLSLLQKAGFPAGRITEVPYQSEEIREGLALLAGQEPLAYLGSVSPAWLKRFDCRQEVLYADLWWERILQGIPKAVPEIRELPKFPEVRRDLALLLDREVPFSAVESLAFSREKKLLKKVGLFDVYEGEGIGKGKKSYAVSFILQDETRTLTEADIESVMEKLAKAFTDQLGAQIR
ncbi:MAG TPA: phenylalanine--tRNA ligase subunit beta [Bacteroidales bacterium]|nr:phenylalanine--tRNA ligase subunit beta [Bacteroidales bacterium]